MLGKIPLALLAVCCLMVRCQGQITEKGCGDTKTCYWDPTDCDVATAGCRFFSWQKTEENNHLFEMSGGTGGGKQYIAIALGIRPEMQDADLYYCDGVEVRNGAIHDIHVAPTYSALSEGVIEVNATTINGVAQCSFIRPASVRRIISGIVVKDFDITKEEYYLLWAVGEMTTEGEVTRHAHRDVSFEKKNFGGGEITPNIVTDTDCGGKKTCFKDPTGCTIGHDANCRFFSWMKNYESGMYDFELVGGYGNGNQYIAMALGTHAEMHDADLYWCDGNAVYTGAIQELHSPPSYSEMTGGLATIKASTTNGVAQCVFSRPAAVTKTISGGVEKNFDITKEEYHILGAIGSTHDDHIDKHDVWTTVTQNTFNFGSVHFLSETGCGGTKTCIMNPEGCTIGNSGCRFFSWAKVDDSYIFEMSGSRGNGDEYVSFALGTTNKMQDADLYYCDGVAVRTAAIRTLHKEPSYMDMDNGLATISARTIDGVAHCVMSRPASVKKEISNGVVKDFNLEVENFFFLAAAGEMRDPHAVRHGATEVTKHTWRMVTDEKVVAFSSVGRVQMLSPCILAFVALMIMKSSDYFTA